MKHRKLASWFFPSLAKADRRKAVIVLGNHRSGTSALTRSISLLGAGLPGNLMPETADNPNGYWESMDLVEVNDAVLGASGTNWHDDAPIDDGFFSSPAIGDLKDRAKVLLEAVFRDSRCVVLKDPRLCRLVPFWQEVLEACGAETHYVLIHRQPQEVALSFKARFEAGFHSFSSEDKSDLIWLRHTLDAERRTRPLSRTLLSYDALLSDWRKALAPVVSQVGFPLRNTRGNAKRIDDFLRPRHRCNLDTGAGPAGKPRLAASVYARLSEAADCGAGPDVAWLDGVRAALDTAEADYAPLRAANRLNLRAETHWHSEVLARATDLVFTPAPGRHRVLYISPNPATPMHTYRVAHMVSALQSAGMSASWVELQDDMPSKLEGADIVVVQRAMWSDELARCKAWCQRRQVPFLYDIDDLIFDRSVMTPELFPHLPQWQERNSVEGYARAVAEADAVVVSTQPLADAVRGFNPSVHVQANRLDDAQMRQADAAMAEFRRKPSEADGKIRLGFASGSPTHTRNFATIVPVLCGLLTARPDVFLSIVGHLDLSALPELQPFDERIETRPLVQHDQLLREYARFDINLAPLEVGNPFCEAKSQLKFLHAGIVAVPTVASSTQPFRQTIRHGETGFVARDPAEWRAALLDLIDDPEKREHIGGMARTHISIAFGPGAQAAEVSRLFNTVRKDA